MKYLFIRQSIPIVLLLGFLTSCAKPIPLPNEQFTSVSVKDFKGVTNKTDLEVRVYSGALDTKIVVNAPTKLAEKLNVTYVGNNLIIDSGNYCVDIQTTKPNTQTLAPKNLVKKISPVQKAINSTKESNCEELFTTKKPFIEIFGPGVTSLSNFSTGGMVVEYLKADNLLVNNFGQGDIQFTRQLTLQTLEATNTSTGNIKFTSKVTPVINSTKFKIQGSGNIHASTISTNSTEVNLEGAGSLQVNTLKEISGVIKGDGTLTLFKNIPTDDLIIVGFDKVKLALKPTIKK